MEKVQQLDFPQGDRRLRCGARTPPGRSPASPRRPACSVSASAARWPGLWPPTPSRVAASATTAPGVPSMLGTDRPGLVPDAVALRQRRSVHPQRGRRRGRRGHRRTTRTSSSTSRPPGTPSTTTRATCSTTRPRRTPHGPRRWRSWRPTCRRESARAAPGPATGRRAADPSRTHRRSMSIALSSNGTAYVDALRRHGWETIEVPPADDCADAVFIEDTIVMFGDLAVISLPGRADPTTRDGRGEATVRQPRVRDRADRAARNARWR